MSNASMLPTKEQSVRKGFDIKFGWEVGDIRTATTNLANQIGNLPPCHN
jgi:hypothetical protein